MWLTYIYSVFIKCLKLSFLIYMPQPINVHKYLSACFTIVILHCSVIYSFYNNYQFIINWKEHPFLQRNASRDSRSWWPLKWSVKICIAGVEVENFSLSVHLNCMPPEKTVDITRTTEWLHKARRLLYEGPDSYINDGPAPSGVEAQP